MSLSGFSARMRLRANNVDREVGKTVQKAALRIDQALVSSTPVDTGRARSNWIASLGTPADEVVDPTTPASALARNESVLARRQSGQEVHITNNVPYIGLLNEGHSAQAPAGFVRAAIQAGIAGIANARIDTG